MQRLSRLTIALFIPLMLLVSVFSTAPVYAGGNVSPRAVMQAYYANINTGRYDLAYAQWTNPPQAYAQFVAGYGDTSSVEAYFGGFQPAGLGSTEGSIPSVLIGHRKNGSVAAFTGCYNLSYNDAVTGVGQWMITGAAIRPLAAVPDAATVRQLLGVRCYDYMRMAGYGSSVVSMLVDYYNAINLFDYAPAYRLWFNPPQTYQNFVTGFADTTDVVMFSGGYNVRSYGTPANGSVETGCVPVVLFGYHTDGSLVAFQGHLIVRYTGAWSLQGAELRPLPFAAAPDKATIRLALSTPCKAAF
jgi:hypothetical protein